MRRRNKIIIGVLLAVAAIMAGFVVWAETPPAPMPEAYAALESDSSVTVTVDSWLVFSPATSQPTTGLIIYPGGRVDYRSYAPLARAIAAENYLVVVPRMPLNLAVFGAGMASDVIRAHPEIGSWAVGGHSLGGSMAAQFAHDNPSEVKGLVLWASYPPSGVDLSGSGLLATTVRGTNDGLVSDAKIDESMGLLPPTTVRVEIQGGNHAYFGWYGDQAGDNPATITRESQQDQTVATTVELLGKI